MKLAVVCPHPVDRAPSQRLKYEQYFGSWTQAGFDVEVFPFWDEAAWEILYASGRRIEKAVALRRAFKRRRTQEKAWLSADLVYIHLGMAPIGRPRFEQRLIDSGVPFVYDIDDLVHLPHGSRANPFMQRLRSADRVTLLLRAAAQVVVCTEHLHSFAEQYNPNVTDISSTVDTRRYRPRPHRDRPPLVIGWSGSHSTSPYLHLLDAVLVELARTDNIRLRVIGDANFQLPGVDVEATAWTVESEVADLSEIDVGVYPLPEEEWVLGKSGLKALQYMSLAIPTVAERIGSNTRIIRDGESGFLVRTPEEWLDRLRRLVRDPGLRERMGAAGHRTVVDRYSVEKNEPAYLRVLNRALGRAD